MKISMINFLVASALDELFFGTTAGLLGFTIKIIQKPKRSEYFWNNTFNKCARDF